MRLWACAAERSGDADIGIHVAEVVPVASFEMHAYAILSSGSVREAFRRAVRYQRLIHESATLVFNEMRGHATLMHSLPGGIAVPRQPAEFLAATWVRMGRMVSGDVWVPRRVLFAHDVPRSTSEHVRFFGTAPEFQSGMTAIDIDDAILDRSNPRADPALAALMDRYADALLQTAPAAATTSDRVMTWLSANLQNGTATLDAVAGSFGMSTRALQRALEGESTSLTDLVTAFRRRRSVQLLRESELTVGEITYLLGFSEVSAFHRAFRRWTGRSPAAFRKGEP